MRQHQGYELERLVDAAGDGDEVPAFLLRPDDPTGAAVVLFHQHNAEWHLGKSEVTGLVGDAHQALPPPLAASVLRGLDGIDPDRIGAVGHSFGGHTTRCFTAVDERIRFACVSGAAGSFRARIDSEVGIGLDQLAPDIARRLDFTALVRCIAPRPLPLVAGEDDRYALDAGEITDDAHPAFENAGAGEMLRCEIMAGGHALTAQRHRSFNGPPPHPSPTPRGRQPGRRLPMTDTRRSDRKPIRQDPPMG